MAYLSQTDLIKQFIQENLQEGNAGNGHVRNNQYLHFWTPIMERYGKMIIFNQTRYSLVTGRLQKQMKELIPADKIIVVSKVPENYKGSLADFLPKDKMGVI